jgi:hypothetical protein
LKVLLFWNFQPKQKSRNWRFFDSKILLNFFFFCKADSIKCINQRYTVYKPIARLQAGSRAVYY